MSVRLWGLLVIGFKSLYEIFGDYCFWHYERVKVLGIGLG